MAMRPTLAIACGITLVASDLTCAELVYFARGGRAQLAATLEGNQVRLETPDGPRIFPKADFNAIIPGHRPLEEWAAWHDELKGGDPKSRFAAAWWALENGLTQEATKALDELRPVRSTWSPLDRAIAAIERLSPPCPEPDLGPLRLCLGAFPFRVLESPHVILLHQQEESEARERIEVIERVLQTFYIACAARGVELPTPTRRIVSVYFAEHRDYIDFLRKVDAEAFISTQGYYHPILHAVFAFDTRSGGEQKAGRRAVTNRRLDGEVESELARRLLLLNLDWRTNDLGIVAHETIHQLTDESGLAPRSDDFPAWLHEGLAAQFEVVRGGRWAGFGHAHDLRLPDWRSIRPAPRLIPLLHDVGFDNGYRRDLYAESWALVYFLRKTHPGEFQAFLDLLRTPNREAAARSDRSFNAFRAAFGGDFTGLESAWHRFLADQLTPLERGRSDAPGKASGGEEGLER